MDKIQKTFLIGLIVMAILTPIGLIASGTAYGEWGSDELKDIIGYIPNGIDMGENLWKAPFPDYSISGLNENFFNSGVGYIFSALLGSILLILITFIFSKVLVKKDFENGTS